MFLLILVLHRDFCLFLILFLEIKPYYNFAPLVTACVSIIGTTTLYEIGTLIINLKVWAIIELVHRRRSNKKMMVVELK